MYMWCALSYRKSNEWLAKEVRMFEKFLKRLDPKDVQLKGNVLLVYNHIQLAIGMTPPPEHTHTYTHTH